MDIFHIFWLSYWKMVMTLGIIDKLFMLSCNKVFIEDNFSIFLFEHYRQDYL